MVISEDAEKTAEDHGELIDPLVEETEDFSLTSMEAEALGGEDSSVEEGEVIDVGAEALVLRSTVSLAEAGGEWVRSDAAAKPAPEERRRIEDLYRSFAREATRHPRLTEEEERALGLQVRDHKDRDAARRLVVHNLRLAMKMAHQYRRSWTNIMDLVQEASAGMTIAAQRWDPDKKTRFGTYAVYWMRAQLTKFLMTHGRVIHTGNTRAGRKLYYQLPKIRQRLLAAGKEPTIEAIAAEVEEDPREVARVVARLDSRETSLSVPLGEGGATLGDTLEGDLQNPEERAARDQMDQFVGQLTQRFQETLVDERDIAIWNEHLVSIDPTTLVELGQRFGVSKQRMGQISTRLKRAFRRHVMEELGPHTELSWLFQTE